MGKDPKKKDEQTPGPTSPDQEGTINPDPLKEAPTENQNQASPLPDKDPSQKEVPVENKNESMPNSMEEKLRNESEKDLQESLEVRNKVKEVPDNLNQNPVAKEEAIPPIANPKDPNFYVSIHFTLKEQLFKDIQKWLHYIYDNMQKDCIVVHAFMTREAVVKKGFSTQVVDVLDTLFPNQKNFFNEETGLPDREGMLEFLKDKQSTSFFIGDIKEGVLEEYELFKSEIQDSGRIITLGSIDGTTAPEKE